VKRKPMGKGERKEKKSTVRKRIPPKEGSVTFRMKKETKRKAMTKPSIEKKKKRKKGQKRYIRRVIAIIRGRKGRSREDQAAVKGHK